MGGTPQVRLDLDLCNFSDFGSLPIANLHISLPG
jgi:hypothetical protein